jgi:hypothetical protein
MLGLEFVIKTSKRTILAKNYLIISIDINLMQYK